MEKFKHILNKKVYRLILVVWPPFAEEEAKQIDSSIGLVFSDAPHQLCVISTELNDLTTPCIHYQAVPDVILSWYSFEARVKSWIAATEEWLIGTEEKWVIDTEYYEVTNAEEFKDIVQQTILDVELVGTQNDTTPFGIKLLFDNDYIFSTPIIDGNTIETSHFNKNNNVANFRSLGEIVYTSVQQTDSKANVWRYSTVRVTKYDPALRDKEGRYTKEEWTDYSDVGRTIAEQFLSYEQYVEVEEQYIHAVQTFLQDNGCSVVKVVGLEKYNKLKDFRERDVYRFQLYETIENGMVLPCTALDEVLRLLLRSYLWCELHGDTKNTVIRFGYDYYMYFNADEVSEKVRTAVEETGLYIG